MKNTDKEWVLTLHKQTVKQAMVDSIVDYPVRADQRQFDELKDSEQLTKVNAAVLDLVNRAVIRKDPEFAALISAIVAEMFTGDELYRIVASFINRPAKGTKTLKVTQSVLTKIKDRAKAA